MGDSIWRNTQFRYYVASTSFIGFSFAMQMLLVTWLLIGVLNTPPERVGFAQAMIGVPGFFLMLWGGVSADRIDPRRLMTRMYGFAMLPPLALAVAVLGGYLSFWAVTIWALAMSVVISYAMPAHTAALNRVAGNQVQEGVSASMAFGFIVQICGFSLAGQLDLIGTETVLAIQSLSLLVGCLMIRRLKDLTPAHRSVTTTSSWAGLKEGLTIIIRDRLILWIMLLNLISMIFNYGSFTIVLPFILTKVYGGDAAFFGWMLALFFFGAAISNFIMLRYMPFKRPGRLFLGMQLTRGLIFVLYWIGPHQSIIILATFLWGLNMGITSTTSRAIVQESAQERFRARILSVYTAGLFGSQPFGALILGFVIDAVGPLNAMIPGMLISVAIFFVGATVSPIWFYQSRTEPAGG
ncbi:MAG: MFS transporter [Deltaproteobacteria bacterium]|nr:MFS transporter [Deltaproteobacteria bacterium]